MDLVCKGSFGDHVRQRCVREADAGQDMHGDHPSERKRFIKPFVYYTSRLFRVRSQQGHDRRKGIPSIEIGITEIAFYHEPGFCSPIFLPGVY